MCCLRTMTATIIIMGRSVRCLGECALQYPGRHILTPGPCRIEFPPLLLCMTLLSLIATSVKYNNQSKLVSGTPLTLPFFSVMNAELCVLIPATGNYIPPLPALLPIRLSYNISHYSYPPLIENLLSNPYTLAPTLFCASLLGGLVMLPS